MSELNKETTQGPPPKNGRPTPVGQASSLTVRAASLPPVPKPVAREPAHLNTGLGSPVNRQAGMPDPLKPATRALVGQASSLTVRAASLPPVPKPIAREQAYLNTGLGSPVNRQAGMPDPQSGRAQPSRPGRFATNILILCCGVVLCLAPIRGAGAEPSALSETQIKALFLFNFTKYVEWPENSFASPSAPLTIGLLGDTGLAEPLRALVAGKTVNGHPIVIEDKLSADKATNCHILFLGAAGQKQLSALLPALRGQPVLVVGEHEKFTRLGGVVNFGWRDNKVRLEINTAAAGQARLKLSSKLLSVADLVQHKP